MPFPLLIPIILIGGTAASLAIQAHAESDRTKQLLTQKPQSASFDWRKYTPLIVAIIIITLLLAVL